MPVANYSTIRDNNASIPPGDIRANTFAEQQIVNSIRQIMADIAGYTGGNFDFTGKTITGGTFTGGSFDGTTGSFSGLLTLTGGQLKFPATQVPSADPNTLDDYEEGSTTPTITTTSGTITTKTCTVTYVKIGKAVSFQVNIHITTNGTGAGGINVPLPFTAGPPAGGGGYGTNGVGALMWVVTAGGSSLFLVKYDTTYPGMSGGDLFLGGVYYV